MKIPIRLSALGSGAASTLLVLAGCSDVVSTDRNDLLGPVHGRADVNYLVSSDGGSIELDNTVDVAKKLGRYRRLNYSEAEKIRRLAQEKFDGFVIQEITKLRPAYESKKRDIRKQSRLQIARRPTDAAKIRRDEEKAIQKLDDEIRAQAIIAVKRRYGSQIAIPLKTRDHKPEVAITKFEGDRVKSPSVAIELDEEPGKTIEIEGKETAVVEIP